MSTISFTGKQYIMTIPKDLIELMGWQEGTEILISKYPEKKILYLEKIKKQCSCLVLREARPEYWAPLGVGILREASRKAFQETPEIFNSINGEDTFADRNFYYFQY